MFMFGVKPLGSPGDLDFTASLSLALGPRRGRGSRVRAQLVSRLFITKKNCSSLSKQKGAHTTHYSPGTHWALGRVVTDTLHIHSTMRARAAALRATMVHESTQPVCEFQQPIPGWHTSLASRSVRAGGRARSSSPASALPILARTCLQPDDSAAGAWRGKSLCDTHENRDGVFAARSLSANCEQLAH